MHRWDELGGQVLIYTPDGERWLACIPRPDGEDVIGRDSWEELKEALDGLTAETHPADGG